jgi:hypothetical protein
MILLKEKEDLLKIKSDSLCFKFLMHWNIYIIEKSFIEILN